MKASIRFQRVFSLFLLAFAILSSFTINGFTLGDAILNALSLASWSNGHTGTHYTIAYSAALCLISFLCYPFRDKTD